jgi:aspartate carbamoyltransferase catalytic subunit
VVLADASLIPAQVRAGIFVRSAVLMRAVGAGVEVSA